MQTHKIRVRLQSYEVPLLDTSCIKILTTVSTVECVTAGPIPMPTKRTLYCVLRSPHVNKDSREHFEIRTHTRILDIYEPSSEAVDSLMKLDLPSGVRIDVKF
uniref:Ribosomal protein S10 n=1 Tax=Cryptomonas sp. CCAC 1634B TaxID=2051848 RepID=A0A679CAZ0_9CRYP|nr:ribosomal protein S10 [Cryptomonas sp. CCAC 1634B]